MSRSTYHILFLCTRNSARSIMAESIVNQLGKGAFQAYSAGNHPAGEVNPFALAQLQQFGMPTDNCRSKHWREFEGADVPPLDFVFTLCDKAAQESCAVSWPGQPITAHWGIPDPAAVEGTEEDKRHAFSQAFLQLKTRIALLMGLPVASLDRLSLQQKVQEIGRIDA